MQSDKSCTIVEQYLSYLTTIKCRSHNTILEYKLDLLQFFEYIARKRCMNYSNFHFVDTNFLRSIQLIDMYGFISYHIIKIYYARLLEHDAEKSYLSVNFVNI